MKYMEGQFMVLFKHALFWNNMAVNWMSLATMVKVTQIKFKKNKSVHRLGIETKSQMDGCELQFGKLSFSL